MLFKNKYLPLQNAELNEEEVRYLIKKIKYWLNLILEKNIFWDQGVSKFLSKQKQYKDIMNHTEEDFDSVYQRLSAIRSNLMKPYKEKVILSANDFILINSVYKKIRYHFFIPLFETEI